MQDSLIDQGVSLLLFGMGTVFIFLTLMVFSTTAMSKIVATFYSAKNDMEREQSEGVDAHEPINPQHIKAIQKAIQLYRNNSRN